MTEILNLDDLENVAGGTAIGRSVGAAAGRSGTYVVQAGDTLSEIAQKFGIASSKLALLNADIIIKTAKEHGVDLKNPEDFVNYLYPGEILQLP